MGCSGNHQNNVWFAEEDEEENVGFFGVVFFFVSHLHSMVDDRPLLCSEIDIKNES